MRKFLLIISFVVLILLDWAALDDITTGNEPSFVGEYAILIISVPLLILIARQYMSLKQSS